MNVPCRMYLFNTLKEVTYKRKETCRMTLSTDDGTMDDENENIHSTVKIEGNGNQFGFKDK